MRPVAVIHPMRSRCPTGIGIAGDAIAGLLPDGWATTSPRLDRYFEAINDGPLPGFLRALARLGLAQLAPCFFPRTARLIFASHHAPLWRTGRHAVVLYDTIPLQFPRQARAQTAYYRCGLSRAIRCANFLVTISAAVRDEFVERGFEGVRTAAVIPAWSAVVGGARTVESRTAGELLVVGARYPHKNLDVVLAALEQLNRESLAPWRLTVAGANRHLWAREWGGLEHFERLGWLRVIDRVDPAELAALYARATALIYPSLAEGQGLPPLEAMAAGCPVICSDLPVLHETCADAALYFSATDPAALVRVVREQMAADSAAWSRRTSAVHERLHQFGRAALAERWRVFLEEWP